MYKIKHTPEDFFVREELKLELKEKGDYSYFILRKRKMLKSFFIAIFFIIMNSINKHWLCGPCRQKFFFGNPRRKKRISPDGRLCNICGSLNLHTLYIFDYPVESLCFVNTFIYGISYPHLHYITI